MFIKLTVTSFIEGTSPVVVNKDSIRIIKRCVTETSEANTIVELIPTGDLFVMETVEELAEMLV